MNNEKEQPKKPVEEKKVTVDKDFVAKMHADKKEKLNSHSIIKK